MYKGRIRMATPMLWFLGFIGVFTFGGITGVMLGIPPADFQFHNSLFLVAHFHSNVIGGVLFGIFAGITYWFPKMSGYRLNERLGRYAFWCWMIGFSLSFIPMYIVGLMGATRRLDTYDVSTGWQPFYVLMLIGGIIIAIGVALQLAQIIASVIQKKGGYTTRLAILGTAGRLSGRSLRRRHHTTSRRYLRLQPVMLSGI